MKKLHLSLLFSLAVLTATSQKVYFVYIQTESEQPFFVKMNEKINSSTASGYIILSKLHDSTYNFSIGFPQNKWPEQNFSIAVNKKDHGFLLKKFGEKGWGLFDLQTLAVQMGISSKASIDTKPKGEIGDVSAFTEILSKAADDPSLKEKPVQLVVEEKKTEVAIQEVIKKDLSPVIEENKVEIKETVITKPADAAIVPIEKKEEPKAEIKETIVVKPVETIELPVVKKEEIKTKVKEQVVTKPIESIEQPVEKKQETIIEIKEQPITQQEETKAAVAELYKVSQVKRWSESSTTEGFGVVFIDDYENGTKDTIRLIIPNPKPIVNIIKEEPKEEKKFLDIITETPKKEELPTLAEEKIAEVKPVVTEVLVEKAVSKNNCSETASESDFFKLRKRMAAAENDDDMISEARKYFKTKCFTSAQIKNLSTLFLNDEGKYKFFDASYKYVPDAEAFTLLESELKDEYYTNRFKAMLRN